MDIREAFDKLTYCPFCARLLSIQQDSATDVKRKMIYSCPDHGDFRLRGKGEEVIEWHEVLICFEVDPLS